VVTGAIPGNVYILSAKYESKSIIGSTFGNCGINPTVEYTFISEFRDPLGGSGDVIPESEGIVFAVANCSDNTPNPPSCTNSEPVTITVPPVTLETTLDVFPNPFNTTANIQFSVPESGQVIVEVYNLTGSRISTLFNDYAEENRAYTLQFSGGAEVYQATYIVIIRTGNESKFKRLMMIR
jgi:hypothetical protein